MRRLRHRGRRAIPERYSQAGPKHSPGHSGQFARTGKLSAATPSSLGPFRGVRIISVNSVFFSNKYQAANFADACSPVDSTAAARTFAWLESNLAQAAQDNEKVWLMFHIPPGIDGYSTMMQLSVALPGRRLALKTCAARRSFPCGSQSGPLSSSTSWPDYQTTITATFAGHDHTDDFRVIHAGQAGAAIRPDRSAHLAHLRPESRLSRRHLRPAGGETGRSNHLLSDQPPGCAERRSRHLDAGVQLCRGMAQPTPGRDQPQHHLRPDQKRPGSQRPVAEPCSTSPAPTTTCPQTVCEPSSVPLRHSTPPPIRRVIVPLR